MPMTNKGNVLSDHKKVGKKFIPPIIDKLGSTFQETSWVKFSIPELVWIALLNYRCGYKDGADLSLSLAKATKEVTNKKMITRMKFNDLLQYSRVE